MFSMFCLTMETRIITRLLIAPPYVLRGSPQAVIMITMSMI